MNCSNTNGNRSLVSNYASLGFDEGRLSKDPAAAQKELDKFLAIMDSTRASSSVEEDPLGYLFQTIWDRVKMVICHPFFPPTVG